MARTIPISFVLLIVAAMLVAALPIEASDAGTELFLPAVGTGPGVSPSYWYTTVWVFNPNEGPAEVEFNFLRKNQSNNPSDVSETIIVEPGEVVQLDDATEKSKQERRRNSAEGDGKPSADWDRNRVRSRQGIEEWYEGAECPNGAKSSQEGKEGDLMQHRRIVADCAERIDHGSNHVDE